jgi:beta-glucanase (GH16 family)
VSTTRVYFAIGIFFTLLFASANQTSAQTWTLTWVDEFDGAVNSAPNPTKWGYDTGGSGWGNNELQTYTNRLQNVYLDGEGRLIIKVIKETFTGTDGITRNYTSARLLTKGKFEQKYGRFEVRLKVPFGQGIWPAFWMLGNNIDSTGWPTCGEIDIMEHIGKQPSVNHGTLHGPGYSGGNPLTGTFTLPNSERFTDDFHTFAVEWEPNTIRFYVDDNLYQTKTTASVPVGRRWVFDHPFFMILNVAVGGSFPGNPDDTTTFPQMLVVDYVRVYANAATRPVIKTISVSKKHLLVEGENFDNEATIWMDGEKQKTLHDEQNPNLLTGKKLAKRIPSGQIVNIYVRNSDGLTSPEVSFLRP